MLWAQQECHGNKIAHDRRFIVGDEELVACWSDRVHHLNLNSLTVEPRAVIIDPDLRAVKYILRRYGSHHER